jgi:zinc transport system substrate-binding protein
LPEYGLQIPIESEGKDQSRPIDVTYQRGKAQGIKVVFAQPQFSTRSAETIAKAIGGEVIPSDDLAPDWEEKWLAGHENKTALK